MDLDPLISLKSRCGLIMPLALACIQPEFVGINQMQQRQLDASGTLEETALA